MENHSNGYNGTSTNGHLYNSDTGRSSKQVLWQSDSGSAFLRAARSGQMDKVVSFMENGTDINTCNQNGLNALHLSSKEGHVDVVRELLARGAAVDAVTRKGNAAIHVASLAGQEAVVQLLVQAGANVNTQSQNGFTPLYMAAQEGHDKVVRYLLQHGANQSITTEDGFTPLAVSLQQGHDSVVTVLLEHDCRGKVRLPALHIAAKKDDCKAALLLIQKVDVTSRSGFTPLHIAAHYDNRGMALLLIDRGANVNYEAKHQITPLHVAAKWGRGGMVELLSGRGGRLECRTRDGLTPLHCAARSGHDTVLELLLKRGADISAKTKNGLTPLHMAAQGDHVDSARMLLFYQAPIDDITVDYLTALHVAAHCGHVRVAKLLMERQADASARALNGFTPLHIACKKNRLEVVQLLLKQGADLEATTESGLTPLHVASFMGCMDIVICLLQHKARVDHPTIRGETPLHLAARSNQTDIIRILLKNRAQVDSAAREQQTALHIATRLGNIDTVQLLLQYKAGVNITTRDAYTPLHIAAKEDQHEVAEVLLNAGASLSALNSSGFTPLHVAAKYGSVQVAALLIPRGADVNATGKYEVTPLHVAVHYNNQKVALLLLEAGASVKAAAKNGFTPLHIAAKNNQIENVTALLEYGADCNTLSQGGYSPLHLAALHGHTDLATLLLAHGARATVSAPGSSLTPLHLAAERGEPSMASLLLQHGADTRASSAAGFTPLHVAAHHGHAGLVRLLLQHSAEVNPVTSAGYTPLHQAAQQGHTLVINLLLQHRATPEATTNSGQTALSIAERLGYVSVVETLKVVTETTTTTTVSGQIQETYHVQAPETMHETFMSDSEDETAEEPSVTDTSYKYLTVDEMKSLGDETIPMDTSRDETLDRSRELSTELLTVSPSVDELMTSSHSRIIDLNQTDSPRTHALRLDNVDIDRSPVTAGSHLKWRSFLVSFMVDARGGAMRGCRHSGVRVIVPPRKAAEPMRITCRYLKKDKLLHPPPLMEGEALASRILEMGPSQAKFLGPVILEVPHFAALRGRQREIVVLRCDDGSTWREHRLETSQQAVQEVLNESFDGAELKQLEDLNTDRITRILTTDFPQYFAIISRLRQEIHAVGPEGGTISSTVAPQVQAVFPAGALTKKIRVGLQAQPVSAELVTELLGAGTTASPIVTIEPRRRKFHKPITLTIPLPQKRRVGVISASSGNTPALRLLCSITGGNSAAQWEDVTGSTPLTYISDCVSFTSTVSARFWLLDCRGLPDTPRLATQLYQRANLVPFMAKFVVFAKRVSADRGRLRVFCMTDDREDKTLEHQEHFHEVAKSKDVEVLDGSWVNVECEGNLSCDLLSPGSPAAGVNGGCSGRAALRFSAFRENRCGLSVHVADLGQEPSARLIFTSQEQDEKHALVSTLSVCLPTEICPLMDISGADSLSRVTSPSVLDNTNEDIPDTLDHEIGELQDRNDLALAVDRNGADGGDIDDASTENGVQLRHKRCDNETDAVGKLVNPEIHRAEIRVTDIACALGDDWRSLADRLDIGKSDIDLISSEYSDDVQQQATVMLRLWMANAGRDATGNALAEALDAIGREDIVHSCCVNVTMVTNALEATIAKQRLSQSDVHPVSEQNQHYSAHVKCQENNNNNNSDASDDVVAGDVDGLVAPVGAGGKVETGSRVIVTPRLSAATGVTTVQPANECDAPETNSAAAAGSSHTADAAEDRLNVLLQLGEALQHVEANTQPAASHTVESLTEESGIEPVLESDTFKPGQSPLTSIVTVSDKQTPTEVEGGARVIVTPRLSAATGVTTVQTANECDAPETNSAAAAGSSHTAAAAEDRLNVLLQLGEALQHVEANTQPAASQSVESLTEESGIEPVLESDIFKPGQSPLTSIVTVADKQTPTGEKEGSAMTPPPSPAGDKSQLTESRQSLPSEGDLQSSEMTVSPNKSDGDETVTSQSMLPHGQGASVDDPARDRSDD